MQVYRVMATARQLDEKMLVLVKQGHGFFHIGCSGHEAAQVAAAACFKPGSDWAFPYYREAAFTLQWGMTPRDHLLSSLGRAADPMSGGRQLPQHYSSVELRIPSQSSPTGTQYLQAVGVALGAKMSGSSEVVYVGSGEGATSQGDFHEALNWSGRQALGVIFHVQDNEYAISTHISEQTAGGSVYKISAGYDSLARFEVDGSDFFEVSLAFRKAVERARQGEGPSLIVTHVPRLLPHSSSDDQRKYRPEDELAADRERDPLLVLKAQLLEAGLAQEGDFAAVDDQVAQVIGEEARRALEADQPEAATARRHVYAEEALPGNADSLEPEATGEEVVLVDSINHALAE